MQGEGGSGSWMKIWPMVKNSGSRAQFTEGRGGLTSFIYKICSKMLRSYVCYVDTKKWKMNG